MTQQIGVKRQGVAVVLIIVAVVLMACAAIGVKVGDISLFDASLAFLFASLVF
jgi:hypothetical protein